jgi:cobalt-zinc-cadmium efflux system protein
MSSHTHDRSALTHRQFAIATVLTLCYVLAEMYAGMHANSMSLLADAVHNLGDSLGLLLAWMANWLLSFPPGKRYSYGFRRTTIMAALINAFVLVGTSAIIAYGSIYKFFHPAPVDETVVIVVALIGIVVNGGSSMLFMQGAKQDLNIRGAFLHLLADALILVGVVVGAGLITLTGFTWIDPVIGLLIVGIVLWGTWGLLRHSLRLMMDAVPHYIDQAGVKAYLSQLPGVTAIHDLHIWGLSTREVALTVHLIMPQHTLTDEDHQRINTALHEQFHIDHVTIQVETGRIPDLCGRQESC